MDKRSFRSQGGDAILQRVEEGQLSPAAALPQLDRSVLSPSPAESPAGPKNLEEIMKDLDSLIGLGKIKKLVKEVYAWVEIQKQRQAMSLINEPLVLHMIFKGNPGTGKTTVARILAQSLKDLGVLSKGHLIEVERADLVGEYIGHTAQKTREQMRQASGGILFVDEAYALARGGDKDFGKEAIDTMVKAMEDMRENLILILAGYQDEPAAPWTPGTAGPFGAGPGDSGRDPGPSLRAGRGRRRDVPDAAPGLVSARGQGQRCGPPTHWARFALASLDGADDRESASGRHGRLRRVRHLATYRWSWERGGGSMMDTRT